jgi:hypothetical protein
VAGFLGGPSLTADKLELHQFASGLRLEVALARGAPAVLGRFAAHRTVRGEKTRPGVAGERIASDPEAHCGQRQGGWA